MKKMVTYLVTLGMMLSMIPASAAAEEGAAITVAATEDSQQAPVINPTFYMFSGYVKTDSDNLNLREAANTNSKILDTIPNGTKLDIYSSGTKGWYLTIYNNKRGYVSADFIKRAEGVDPKAYHEDSELPASSISVAALAGTWTDMNTFEKLEIREVRDASGNLEIYKGAFTFTDKDGKKTEGSIKLLYTRNPDDTKDYWFTFFDKNDNIWCAFIAENTIQLDHLIAGQAFNAKHFGQYLFGGYADVKDSLNLRSDMSTDAEILAKIPANTELNIFDSMANGWYKTIFDGHIGYVSADYIKKIANSVTTTTAVSQTVSTTTTTTAPAPLIDMKDIAGRWRFEEEGGVFDGVAAYNLSICADYDGVVDIKENGTYEYTDINGRVSSGKVVTSEETMADGTKFTILTLKQSNGKALFSGYYEKNAEYLYAGNGGIIRIVRDTAWNEGIEQIAIERMENYEKIDALLAGAIVTNTDDKVKSGDYEYIKVTDTTYKSVADIKAFIDANTTGELNKTLYEFCDATYKDINGALYVLNGGKGSMDVDTSWGLYITDKTDKSFTATTIGMKGVSGAHRRAVFTAVDSDWKMSSFETDFYTVNKTADDFRECAERRIGSFKVLMSDIAGGFEVDSNVTITVNGVKYAKEKYQVGDTIADLKKWADDCTTGDLRKSLYSMIEERFIVKDGVLYVSTAPAKAQPDFNNDKGARVLSIAPDEFTASTVAASQKDGYAHFNFKVDGDKFLISSYKFSEFSEDRLFGGYVSTQSDDLNLREQPNTTSKILASIPNGTQLDIYACNELGWYKTIYDGKIGYVSDSFIRRIPSSDVPAVTTTTTVNPSSTTTTTTATSSADSSSTTTTVVVEVRDSEQIAKEKMTDLNLIWAILGTSSSTPTEDGYSKVASETIKSIADFKALVTRTCSGDLRTQLISQATDKMTEKNGALYVKNTASAYYQFQLGKGITVTDPAMNAFTAIANAGDQLYGTGKVTIKKEDGNWYITEYEFGDFGKVENKGDLNGDGSINLKDVVLLRRYIAGGWGVTLDEKLADVNGDNSVNLKDVVLLRRYIAGGWGVKFN